MKKLTIFIVLVLMCSVAWAAIDSEVKRRAVQPFQNPTADGSIDVFDRGMLAGVYIASTPSATVEEGEKLDGRSRYNFDRGYRWRYKF